MDKLALSNFGEVCLHLKAGMNLIEKSETVKSKLKSSPGRRSNDTTKENLFPW